MVAWDTTMPLDFVDGQGVDEGDLDPVVKNLESIRNAAVCVGGQVRITNATATSGTAESIFVTGPTLTLDPNTTYRIWMGIRYVASVIGDRFQVAIREDNLAGAIRILLELEKIQVAGTGLWHSAVIHFPVGGTPVTKTFVGTVSRAAGTGTLTALDASFIVYDRFGSGTLITTV